MHEALILESKGASIIHLEVGQPRTGASIEALNKLKTKMFSDQLRLVYRNSEKKYLIFIRNDIILLKIQSV